MNPGGDRLARSSAISARVGLSVALVASLLATGAAPAWAAGTFYVDTQNPAASNSNPGTEALPYKTISGAAAVRNGPGTIIIVKPGTYRETITVPASGAAGNPYVFQASGPGAIVDGSDDFSGTSKWTLSSGSVYRASTVNWSPKQVYVDGVRLTPATGSPASLPVNSFVYVSGGSGGLYVNIGGANPGTRATLVGRRTYGFRVSAKTYVTIQGFTVTRTEDRAIYAHSASDYCVVRGNTVNNAYKYGIGINGCAGALVEQNIVSYNQDHGIALTGTCTGCTVQDNESFNNSHPTVRQANGIYLNRSTNNLIQRNRLHDNQDTGHQYSASSNDNLSIQNVSWNNGDHGYDHLNSSNSTSIGNVAYANYKDGFSIEGTSPGTRLYNCIGIDNGIAVLPADGVLEYNLWVDSQSSVGFVSDYNIFWNSTSQPPVKFISTIYPTVAAYSAASGQDVHSTQANPLFVNPGGGDFHLTAASPAIDAGTSGVPSWPATDADGNARVDDPSTPNTGAGPVPYADRGAYEAPGTPTNPPIVTAPATASVAEGAPLSLSVTASDPDGEAIGSFAAAVLPPGATFTPGPGNTTGTLDWTPTHDQAGSYTVTFTATNTLSGSASTVITVSDVDRAPVVTVSATASVAEGAPLALSVTAADLDGGAIGSLTATDLPPGATFTPDPGNLTGTLNWTPTFTQSGAYTVTFTATNALSGSASTVITVSELDRAPLVTSPATATVAEGAPLTLAVTASDPDGDPLGSLTAADLPAGAIFTADPGDTTGTLTWTPAFDQAGSHTVTFTAANALSGSSGTVITVDNVDRAPVVTGPATVTGEENSPISVSVTATDPDGDAIASLVATDLPPGATFTPGPDNTTGTLDWTPGFDQAGTYTVTFTAGNALSGSMSTSVTLNNVDRAPVVTAPASAGVIVGNLLTVEVSASDPDGDAITALSGDVLPPGATFTPGAGNTSGTFTWTPGPADAGDRTLTFTATNDLSGSASTLISVSETDRAPVVSAPATAGGRALELITFAVSASDPDGHAIVSLDAAGLPSGATFTPGPGNVSGTFSWTPAEGDVGAHSVTFTATNALSGSAVTSITVTPADQAPIVTAPATAAVNEAEALSVSVTVADPDGDPIMSLTATDLPAGASFTPGAGNTSGTLSWTPSFADAGPYTVMFTASNAKTGSASTSITVANVDRAPIVTAPASAGGAAGTSITVDVTATDPDGDAIASLDASGMPAGATFTPGAGHTSGTLSWTPNAGDVGTHSITFTAANALSGSAGTTITVTSADQAPVVTAPATAVVNEAAVLSVGVTVADPDGDAITSLAAAGVPPGATFTPGAGNTSGTLSWTPSYSAAGEYTVTFTASNALSSSSSTTITVSDVDRAPVVTAPATASGRAGTTITVGVTAADPDGNAIGSLAASGLPAGATFTPGPDNTSGTFTWTPGAGSVGDHMVTFTATNALSGTAATTVTVLPPNQLPVAALAASPATGNELLSVTADASGSADPDGTIASYTFNFGDGVVVGPQASPWAAPHAYAAGNWTLTVTVTDNDGGTGTSSVPILVAAVPSQPNLVGNPSFEVNTTGWGVYSAGTLARVAGGFDGGWGLQMSGPATTGSFGCNDSPNWVLTVPAAGNKYRFTAWVRSVAHRGTAKLQVREYLGTTKVGSIYSTGVVLSSGWQPVTVDYTTVSGGSTLDFQVIDFPLVASEVFVTDNISIRNVTGTAPAQTAGNEALQAGEQGPTLDDLAGRVPLRGTLSPSPLRSRSTLTFVTTRPGPLEVVLYEVTGRRVGTLLDLSEAPAGLHQIPVESRQERGEPLSPGVYFYRIRGVEGVSTGRFVFVP